MAWNHVPQETFEAILGYLDLQDIKNVRLVSKEFSVRCLGPYFLSFFQNVTTDLTKSSLHFLHIRTSHPVLKRAISNLTVVATVYSLRRAQRILLTKQLISRHPSGTSLNVMFEKCTPDELTTAQSDIDWLQKQEAARDALSDTFIIDSLAFTLRRIGKISTIRLHASMVDSPEGQQSRTWWRGCWKAVWHRASHVYHLTLSAIVASKIPVYSLDVYGQTPGCSIPSADITTYLKKLNQDDLKAVGAMIKSIALKVSTKVKHDLAKSAELQVYRSQERRFHLFGELLDASDPQIFSEDNYSGIVRLLQATSNLSTLYLHLYRTVTGNIKPFDRLFSVISENVCLDSLEVCSLSGLFVTEGAMLRFLKSHPRLRHLELEELALTSGSWSPVYRSLSGMSSLTYLRLSSLWGENDILENLQPVWAPWPPPRDIFRNDCFPTFPRGPPMVHRREFFAENLEMGLEFLPSTYPHIPTSSQLVRWGSRRRDEYGKIPF